VYPKSRRLANLIMRSQNYLFSRFYGRKSPF
jgi:hypothetical protein